MCRQPTNSVNHIVVLMKGITTKLNSLNTDISYYLEYIEDGNNYDFSSERMEARLQLQGWTRRTLVVRLSVICEEARDVHARIAELDVDVGEENEEMEHLWNRYEKIAEYAERLHGSLAA